MILIYFFPLIGALIAYVIAYLGIKQFLKYQPTSRTTLSGIMQKNRLAIIDDLALMTSEKVKLEDVVMEWLDESKKKQISEEINKLAGDYIDNTILVKYPMITMLGGEKVTQKIKSTVEEEVDKLMIDAGPKAGKYAAKQINLQQLLASRLEDIELEEIHTFVVKLLRNQIVNVTTLFVITGFLIGMIFMIISVFIV